jgi:hemerythrin-like domain-containing protein
MRGDLHRLVELTGNIGAGRDMVGLARAAALAGFISDVCHAINLHHTREDSITWPLIESSAGAAVDLTDLSDDHSGLDPMLDELRAAAHSFAANPSDVSKLATSVRQLSEHLDEHIEEEERRIFPVIEKYVTAEDWKKSEDVIGKQSTMKEIRFDLAWVDHYATREEMAQLRKSAGPALAILMPLLRPGHRRRQRVVFGASA